MPVMMDTILNLGLNDDAVIGLAKSTGNERFAFDSYRRFIQMYGDVVLGIDSGEFEDILEEEKRVSGVYSDTEVSSESWQKVIILFKELV